MIDLFNSVFENLFADTTSAHAGSTEADPTESASAVGETGSSWEDAFGTACPHQVAAEASSATPAHDFTVATFGEPLDANYSTSQSGCVDSGIGDSFSAGSDWGGSGSHEF